MTIDDVKANLSGQLHGGNVDNLDDVELLMERSANTVLSKVDPIDTIRTVALASTVHDDFDNYALPSDYKKIIDLIPQDNRTLWDKAVRNAAGDFDIKKAISNRVISIEGSEGSKIIRINWKSRQGKVLNTMNSVTANGTWTAVGTAANIQANSIFKKSGSASVEFDIVTTGDGIKNTTMSSVDMTDEDEVADVFVWLYFPTVPTSVTSKWGNDLTAKFWTSVAQTTQADGTAFKVGWNILKFPWSTASETGTVDPATIDSFQITLVASAMNNVRVDNIVFSIGRNFDIKYYSKYILKNSAGTWIPRTTADSDVCVLDSDAIGMFELENLIEASQQMHNDSFDITLALKKLNGDSGSGDPMERVGLYGKYRAEYPTQSKKQVSQYSNMPGRGRWGGGMRRF